MRYLWLLPAVMALGGTNVVFAEPATFVRVIADGLFDEWSTLPVAVADAAHDSSPDATDIRNVWLANDDDFVYVSFEVGDLLSLQTPAAPVELYFDVDRDDATGTAVGDLGADLAIRFTSSSRTFTEHSPGGSANIGHAALSWVSAPTVAGTRFELRLARDAVFPIRGTPIFGGPDFDFLLHIGSDWAPDGSVGHTYTIASGTLPPYPAIGIDRGDPALVRVMSHNMLWDGLVDRPAPFDRILGALQPDIICYQEVQSNTSASEIADRLDAILPLGGANGWHVYKSSYSSVLCSRWPISMTASETIPATGRGQAMARVDLPDTDYDRDLYVISAHYKCCGGFDTSEDRQRQTHSDANANWFRDLREPGGYVDLPAGTPFLIAGDLNMVGGPQPLLTLLDGDIVDEATFGPDSPPDWDGTRLADPVPHHNAGPAAHTWRSDSSTFTPGRLDFVLYTDSWLDAAKVFIFNTQDMSDDDLDVHGLLRVDSENASDHLPIVVDFAVREPVPGDMDADRDVDPDDVAVFSACAAGSGIVLSEPGCQLADLDLDGDGDQSDFGLLQRCMSGADSPGDPHCAD